MLSILTPLFLLKVTHAPAAPEKPNLYSSGLSLIYESTIVTFILSAVVQLYRYAALKKNKNQAPLKKIKVENTSFVN